MSGFEYTFVSQVSQEYFCPICECPMREPVQTKCGHRFCKLCLGQSMKRKRKCPIDRQPLDERSTQDIYPDVAIQRTILGFVVKCPNEHNGCKWTGELRNTQTHESTCTYVGVKCTNKGCDAAPLKKDLDNHVNHECPKRKVQCLFCKAVSFIWCTRQGHFEVCKKYPVNCVQECGEQIPRDQMSDHIIKSCSLTKVECTYAHVGCKAKVQRRAVAHHVTRDTESHLKLACEKLQELQAASTLTATSVKEVQTQMVTAMKKIKELSEEVAKSESLQIVLADKIAAINKRFPKLQSRDDITDNRLSALQADVVNINNEVTGHSGKLSSNEEMLSGFENDIKDLQGLFPRVYLLQNRRGEVVGPVKENLEMLDDAITTVEKQNRQLLQEIKSANWSMEFFSFGCQLQGIRDRAAIESSLLNELRTDHERLKRRITCIICITVILLCVWYIF